MSTYARIRIGSAVTALLGLIYAAAALFDSLDQVALGLLVAGVASTGWGLCDWLEDRQIAEGRAAVWARRDREQGDW